MFETSNKYFKEFYIGSKYIGQLPCEKDREEIGYYGRQKTILTEDVILKNKKKIKKGTEVNTLIYPICEKIVRQSI
jgi:hypothetical protein